MEKLIKFESWAVLWGSILGSVISFVSPVAPFLALASMLILGDWRTGVMAARKRKEIIDSDGFKRTLEKMTVYLVLILSSHGVKLVFFDGFEDSYFPFVAEFPITYIAAFAICIREFKSIAENAYELTGVDFWHIIADRIETVFSLFNKKK